MLLQRKRAALIGLVALFVFPAAAHAADLTLDLGDVKTPASLFVPPGAGPHPGVVLVHGSGPGKRAQYQHVAEAFARQGIVALLYDKRTVGYSQSQRDYSQLANDALTAFRVLRARPEVDPARVGLWGLSEGGWTAPLAASRSDDVAFLITVGANGGTPSHQQAWAVRERLVRMGVSGSMVDAIADKGMRQIVHNGLFPEAAYDPVPVLRRLKQPTLGIWGAKDRLTPPGESLRVFQENVRRHTLRVFPDGEHAAHRTITGFERLPELVPGYAELVGSWVRDLPTSSSADPAPHQDVTTRPLEPLAEWETGKVQITVFAVLVLAFLGYVLSGFVRRWRPGPGSLAPWLASAALAVVGGWMVYVFLLLTNGKLPLGPLVFGRTLPWLGMQLLSAGVVVLLVLTVLRTGRELAEAGMGARIRRTILLTGGALFVPWAFYWGLLLP
ncbi:alpha/beta hydrolase [Allokutzneria sp. A3M-2-11 16]|uniref:alpha/beta hydrolase family protein n=1 Tax=Allokutzneria sp. A3M-2-11 16 TaxID=2962043 RepID=UPI0020B83518|nr:alpha/beta hydrolase [Allokutzneria sp. A3M-2-11 16]MCP3803746.1 alpha/beta hydrolase [Allokutzneria sp. A3M-2-11 16]